MKHRRILVTGGAGFIGSHTVEALLQQQLDVVVLDNLISGRQENLPLNHPHLTWAQGDILDYPLLQQVMTGCDAVLHLAAIVSVPKSIEDPIAALRVNTQGFLHVLQAIKTLNTSIRLVYASSSAVYGEAHTLPCRDDLPLTHTPLSPYALNKLHDEHYADLYARLYGIKSVGLRYFNVYGERQDPTSPYSGVISRFLDAYQRDVECTIFGDGQQSRDFIAVADVVRANLLALSHDQTGAFNIATGKPETLVQLLHYIEAAGGKPARYCFAPARVGDIKMSYAAITEAERCLSFHARIGLAGGIRLLMGHKKQCL
jgi:UDP-glucose 4-epimerase